MIDEAVELRLPLVSLERGIVMSVPNRVTAAQAWEQGEIARSEVHALKKDVDPRLTKLEKLVKGKKMELRLAARIVGLTEDEVREALHIPAEEKLTDKVFLTALVEHIQSVNRFRETHGAGIRRAHEGLKELRTRVSEIEETLSNTQAANVASNVNQGMSLYGALLTAGLSHGDIRIMMQFREEQQEMTDGEFVIRFIQRIALTEACVEEHTQQIENLTQEVAQVNTRIDNIDDDSHIPWWGWLAAAVVGVLVFLFIWRNPYAFHGVLRDAAGHPHGTVDGGWHSTGLGIALGLITAGFTLFACATTRRRQTTTTSSSTTSNTSSNRSATRRRFARFHRRNAKGQVQASATSTQGTNDSNGVDQTTVLPVVPAS